MMQDAGNDNSGDTFDGSTAPSWKKSSNDRKSGPQARVKSSNLSNQTTKVQSQTQPQSKLNLPKFGNSIEGMLQKRARDRGVRQVFAGVLGYPWTIRHVRVDGITKQLTYSINGEVKDQITVTGLVAKNVGAMDADNHPSAFGLFTPYNELIVLLAASSDEERDRWVEALNLFCSPNFRGHNMD